MKRIVLSAYRTFETTLYETISQWLNESTRACFDALLTDQPEVQAGEDELATLHELRMNPGHPAVELVSLSWQTLSVPVIVAETFWGTPDLNEIRCLP